MTQSSLSYLPLYFSKITGSLYVRQQTFPELKYETAFTKLNKAQKQAVMSTEGPVMTIAGPGTGKTQLLAMRVGHILKSTDVFPHNILCLTYTDAAAVEMRNRLLQFIGPDAYQVNIFTFHGFCNR
ncbi:MAG: UvrD-helicase domain-containing protein [Saprospiraceae bacterium]|nr:UvrD-helicase domain-containing protein [Saprospiraceae bacterium]